MSNISSNPCNHQEASFSIRPNGLTWELEMWWNLLEADNSRSMPSTSVHLLLCLPPTFAMPTYEGSEAWAWRMGTRNLGFTLVYRVQDACSIRVYARELGERWWLEVTQHGFASAKRWSVPLVTYGVSGFAAKRAEEEAAATVKRHREELDSLKATIKKETLAQQDRKAARRERKRQQKRTADIHMVTKLAKRRGVKHSMLPLPKKTRVKRMKTVEYVVTLE